MQKRQRVVSTVSHTYPRAPRTADNMASYRLWLHRPLMHLKQLAEPYQFPCGSDHDTAVTALGVRVSKDIVKSLISLFMSQELAMAAAVHQYPAIYTSFQFA